jgi:hypothetical protein
MKPNYYCICAIMLLVERKPNGDASYIYSTSKEYPLPKELSNFSRLDILHHIDYCFDSGYFTNEKHHSNNVRKIAGLSPLGLRFLEQIHKDGH